MTTKCKHKDTMQPNTEHDTAPIAATESDTATHQVDTQSSDTQTVNESGGSVAPQPPLKKKFWRRRKVVLGVAIAGVAVVAAGIFLLITMSGDQKSSTKTATNTEQELKALSKEDEDARRVTEEKVSVPAASFADTKELTFVRHIPNNEFEKNEDGTIKQESYKDTYGDQKRNIRKKSFDLSIERNGQKRTIAIANRVERFGKTTDGRLYAISCEKNASQAYEKTLTIYSNIGLPVETKSWKYDGGDRPSAYMDEDCKNENPSFTITTDPALDISTTKDSKMVLVDQYNYKLVSIAKDGSQIDIDTEADDDFNIPLGTSPDGLYVLYNRVSATRTLEGCSGQIITLSYKIPDYTGPINELRVYDTKLKKDVLAGSEKSFSTEQYPINLSSRGVFSADSTKYYLVNGGRGGCRGGGDIPVRITYIDLASKTPKTISSPTGKTYYNSCFSKDGKYLLMTNGSLYNTNKAPINASVFDTSTLKVADVTSSSLDCWLSRNFVGLGLFAGVLKAEQKSNEDPVVYKGLELFDPATNAIKTVTFTTPLTIPKGYNNVNTHMTNTKDVGAIDVGIAYNDITKTYDLTYATFLFNTANQKLLSVPYAQIVL